MPRYTVERVLPYTPEQLFRLVGDVERYPDFVPWVTALRTWNQRETAGGDQLDAEAQVGFSIVRERFGTRVTRDVAQRVVSVSLLYGPFRRLLNRWSFRPHTAGTAVGFDIDFEFKSRLLDALLAANFQRAVDKLIGCFEARAAALYGPGAAAA